MGKRLGITGVLVALTAVVGLLVLMGGPVAAQDDTRFVATGGDDTGNDCLEGNNPCATIQHTIDEAASGDTIEVAAGTYIINTTLNINKSLTIG